MPSRSSFALTGPSRPLDPRTNAVRPDIADVRLAAQVFAPHYAAPLARTVLRATALREDRKPGSSIVANLAKDDIFDVLDVTGGVAWGIATGGGLVGYVDGEALGLPA